uniref:Uncharacterized protein n=1 Tax=Anopheles merus TaxID=30066 RepID=A0A182VAJ8_ANOME
MFSSSYRKWFKLTMSLKLANFSTILSIRSSMIGRWKAAVRLHSTSSTLTEAMQNFMAMLGDCAFRTTSSTGFRSGPSPTTFTMRRDVKARRQPSAVLEQPTEERLSGQLRFQLGQHQLQVVQLFLDGGGRRWWIREVDDRVQLQDPLGEVFHSSRPTERDTGRGLVDTDDSYQCQRQHG